MEQLEAFVVHVHETKVCKLDKSVYGLKRSLGYVMKSLTT